MYAGARANIQRYGPRRFTVIGLIQPVAPEYGQPQLPVMFRGAPGSNCNLDPAWVRVADDLEGWQQVVDAG